MIVVISLFSVVVILFYIKYNTFMNYYVTTNIVFDTFKFEKLYDLHKGSAGSA